MEHSVGGILYLSNSRPNRLFPSLHTRHYSRLEYSFFQCYYSVDSSYKKLRLIVTSRGVTTDLVLGTTALSSVIAQKAGTGGDAVFTFLKTYLAQHNLHSETIIWVNADKNEIVLSRDAFGVCPLFIDYSPGEYLAFSNNVIFINELTKNKYAINSEKLTHYIANTDNAIPYQTTTFFHRCQTVLPGSIHFYCANSSQSRNYLTFHPEKWQHLRTPPEFGKMQQHFFKASVSKIANTAKRPGAHLSGGLDSASIAATFRAVFPQKELHTFFHDTGTSGTEEGKYALAVAKYINSIHHNFSPPQSHLESLIKAVQITGQPMAMLNSPAKHLNSIRFIKENGCDLLMTGRDGDGVVGYGFSYVNQLIKANNSEELQEAIYNLTSNELFFDLDKNWENFSKETRFHRIGLYYLSQSSAIALKKIAIKDYYSLLKLGRKLGIPASALLRRNIRAIQKKIISFFDQTPSIVSESAPLSYDLNPYGFSDSDKQKKYFYDILFNSSIRVNEEYFALGKYYDLEIAHPFFDPYVYELSLAVPQKLKFGEGLTRGHQREAMRGILPELVRLRTSKAEFSEYAYNSIMELYYQSQDFLTEQSQIWDYANRQSFDHIVRLLKNTPLKLSLAQRNFSQTVISRVINAAVWLDLVKNRNFL